MLRRIFGTTVYLSSIKSLAKNNPLTTLFFIFVLASIFIFIYLKSLHNKSTLESALNASQNYAQFIKQFRSIYTTEVIARLAKSDIAIMHKYQATDTAIPLPTTLSIIISERIKLNGFEIQSKLFSQYPFPSKSRQNQIEDSFQSAAWQAINTEPKKPFIRIAQINGIESIRYAVADIMLTQCVSCHNSHPKSPKTDWKVGDVAGILEIISPVMIGESINNQTYYPTLLLISTLLVFSFLGCVFISNTAQRKNIVLDKLNAALNDEIKLHKQTEKALKNAKDNAIIAKLSADAARTDAVNANRAKSIFLANISHEIRTPMNAILGYTEILYLDHSLNSENQKSLAIIKDSGQNLLMLIDDILDLSKLEAGATKLHICNFDLITVCQSAIAMFRLKAQQKKIALQFKTDISLDSIVVNGDQGKIRQVLINLLGNAIKFTQQGEVVLSLMMIEESVFSLQIMDTGIGIKKQYQATIFDSFDQGNTASSYGGTGLGLSITKKLLDLMHSQIHLESEPNRGTRFYFDICLPIQKKAIPVDNSVNNAQQKVAHLNSLVKKNILIIDDTASNHCSLQKMLLDIGCHVLEATNSLEVQLVLQQNSIDLALISSTMDDWGDFNLPDYIKKQHSHIPIIAISPSTIEANLLHFIDLGFDDYIYKPFNVKDVFKTLAESINIKINVNNQDLEKNRRDKSRANDFRLSNAYSKLIIEQCDLYLVKEVETLIDRLALKFPNNDQYFSLLQKFVSNYDLEGLTSFLKGDSDAG
ncbi:MAG: hypothetical protein OFPII_08950 [Osedax symbiont Rs1]|nr:MAG: hypothetical protein OFPII_08950 [Osedax symbiont Rs1]